MRTGPNNRGHRQTTRWLQTTGIHPDTTHDRELWNSYRRPFLASLGLQATNPPLSNTYWLQQHEYVVASTAGVQGTFSGGMACVTAQTPYLTISHLQRCAGWIHVTHEPPLSEWTLPNLLYHVVPRLRRNIFHCRILCNEFSE